MTGRADQRASAGGDHLAAQCCAAAHALILARFMPLRVLRVLTRSGKWRPACAGLKKCGGAALGNFKGKGFEPPPATLHARRHAPA